MMRYTEASHEACNQRLLACIRSDLGVEVRGLRSLVRAGCRAPHACPDREDPERGRDQKSEN